MNFLIWVSTPTSHTALRYVQQVLAVDHHIRQVFFSHDAVQTAVDAKAAEPWIALAEPHQFPLLVCSAACDARHISEKKMIKGFQSAGLGQLFSMMLTADRFVPFSSP